VNSWVQPAIRSRLGELYPPGTRCYREETGKSCAVQAWRAFVIGPRHAWVPANGKNEWQGFGTFRQRRGICLGLVDHGAQILDNMGCF